MFSWGTEKLAGYTLDELTVMSNGIQWKLQQRTVLDSTEIETWKKIIEATEKRFSEITKSEILLDPIIGKTLMMLNQEVNSIHTALQVAPGCGLLICASIQIERVEAAKKSTDSKLPLQLIDNKGVSLASPLRKASTPGSRIPTNAPSEDKQAEDEIINSTPHRLETLSNQIKALHTAINELKTQQPDAPKIHDERIAKLQESIDSLKTATQPLENQNAEFKTATQERKQHQDSLNLVNTNLSRLEEQLKTLQAQLEVASKQSTDDANNVNLLKLKDEVSKLTVENSRLTAEIRAQAIARPVIAAQAPAPDRAGLLGPALIFAGGTFALLAAIVLLRPSK